MRIGKMVPRTLRSILWALVLLPATPITLAAQEDQPEAGSGSCVECHRDLDDERLSEPAMLFGESIHAEVGLGCEICHGGSATEPRKQAAHRNFVGKPPRRRIPEFCGRCHENPWYMRKRNPELRTDQLALYWTSVHGERLVRYGDTLVAVCSDCHSAHDIRKPSDAKSTVSALHVPETCGKCHADEKHMESYDIDTEVVDNYLQSVHWAALSERGDRSAPVCNDCHGHHGTAPPGVEWVGNVCSECHSQIGNFFRSSPHETVFAYLGVPGCVGCHSNHAVQPAAAELLSLGEGGTCGQSGCHTPDDKGGEVTLAMRAALDSLRHGFLAADSILLEAEQAGMPVSDALFELEQARTTLVQARAKTHTVNLDSLLPTIEAGFLAADTAHLAGVEAFEELDRRRTGLGVSVGLILVLIGGLLGMIRRADRTTPDASARKSPPEPATLDGS